MMIQKALLLTLISIAVSLLSQRTAMTDVTVIPGNMISPAGASPVGTAGRIVKVSVSPAKEASPAFKHRFVIEPHETVAGNSATHYLRSLGEDTLNGPHKFVMNQISTSVYEWSQSKTNADDIPMDKLKEAAAAFDGFVKNHMRRATACRETNWGLAVEDFRGREAIEFLLPSVQQSRTMARALMLQNRLAIIEKRYGDSIDRLRMTYRLGNDVSQMGFLVTSLVGAAEVSMANDGALLLLASDDAPNLYWALAELPAPMNNLRKPMRLESSLILRMFPELLNIENANYGERQWKELFQKYVAEFNYFSTAWSNGSFGSTDSAAPSMPGISLVAAFAGYSSAKQRMQERGHSKESVNAMSVSQLLLIDAAQDIRYFSQMQEKALYLPFKEAKALNKQWEDTLRKQSFSRFGALAANTFLPAAQQVRESVVRVQAETNLLMAIESLRNHAATKGRFPDSLNELELPTRDNPFTGEPFNYLLEGGKAILSFDIGNGRIQRYEVSIKN